ncbi:MAG: alpha/beta hydrolase [Leptospirales bacterium]
MKKRYFLLAFVIIVTLILALYPVRIGLWLQRQNLEYKGFVKHSVDSEAGRVTYFEGGVGKSIVFIHGFLSESSNWLDAVERLLPNYHIVVIDLPGHGDSLGPLDHNLQMQTLLTGMEAVIEVIPTQQFTLVGNSLGGWVSVLYALENSEKVENLVLVNSAGLEWEYPKRYMLPTNSQDYAKKIEMMFGDEAPSIPDYILNKMIKLQTEAHIHLFDDAVSGKYYLDDLLSHLKVDTFLIWGNNDSFFPLEYAKKMAEKIKPKKGMNILHQIEGGGHTPHYTKPDIFVDTLIQMIDEK